MTGVDEQPARESRDVGGPAPGGLRLSAERTARHGAAEHLTFVRALQLQTLTVEEMTLIKAHQASG